MANQPVTEIAVAPENYLNLSKQEKELANQTCELAKEINYLWQASYAHRNDIGVTKSMYEAAYARANKYTPCHWSSVKNKDITLYAGAFSSIRASVAAHMRNMIKTSLQKPWTMEVDAVPEPAPYIKEKAIKETLLEIQSINPSISDPYAIAEDALAKRKDYAYTMLLREAEISAKRAEILLEDQWQNGGGANAVEQSIMNMMDSGTAFIMACEYVTKNRLAYVGNSVKERPVNFFSYRSISSLNVYPTPDSTTTQDGTGVFVIERVSVNELLEIAKLSKNKTTKLAIYSAINKGATSDHNGRHGSSAFFQGGMNGASTRAYVDPNSPQAGNAMVSGASQESSVGHGPSTVNLNQTSKTCKNTLEVVRFLGRLPKNLISTYAEDDKVHENAENTLEDEEALADGYRMVTVDVFMLNGAVIYMKELNYTNNYIPLFGASFRPQQDCFWGDSLYDIISTLEKEIVETNRRIIFHSGYLTHPKLWVDKSKIDENENDLEDILTGKPLVVDYTEPGSVPVGSIPIANNMGSLQGQLQQLLDQAERDTGFPRFAAGNSDISSAARTTGIVSQLMANVSKSVELLHANLARGIIVPAVTLQYELNMLYQRDPSIKATLTPVFKGIEGIAEKEAKMNRFEKVMQTVVPMLGAVNPATGEPVLPEVTMQMFNAGLREYALLTDLVPQSMLSSPTKKQIVQQLSEDTGMPLDGRNVSTLPQETTTAPPVQI